MIATVWPYANAHPLFADLRRRRTLFAMHIRHAREEDANAMARVIVDTFLTAHEGHMPAEAMRRRKEAWTHEVSANAWLRTIREIADTTNPQDCIFVACDEPGEVVGLAMGTTAEGFDYTGEVSALYVRADWQGRGIGRQLVQTVATWLHQHDFATLRIMTLAANAPARKFYEVIGGTVVDGLEIEEYGFTLPGVVYGWPDIRALIPPA